MNENFTINQFNFIKMLEKTKNDSNNIRGTFYKPQMENLLEENDDSGDLNASQKF